jgi:cell division protein FtsZ
MSMSLDFRAPQPQELKPKITVIGVGGAGGNAVNNMIAAGLPGVDFVVANTDAQALSSSTAETRLQLGSKCTQGLGAGARPEIGRAAAEEAMDVIENTMEGSHMVFITAGMGGGTGTGAAPIIAKTAREKGILTVGVVTKPFSFEGQRRMRLADEGIAELQKYVDTMIIIPNQNLFRIATAQTTFAEAFSMADDVLHSGVRSITDLITVPGLINLDFADVRSVMSEMGKAMMGTGEAEGPNRAKDAANAAIANPLLDEVSLRGAKGVIINITGGMDITLFEIDEAANHIREMVDPDANVFFGSALNPEMNGRIRVSVVATGIDSAAQNILGHTNLPANATRQSAPGFAASAGTFHGARGTASAPPIEVPTQVAAKTEEEPLPLTEIQPQQAAPAAEVIAFPGSPVVDNIERPYARPPEPMQQPMQHAPIQQPQQAPAQAYFEPAPIQHRAAPIATPTAASLPLPEPMRSPSLFERMTNGFRRPATAEYREEPIAPVADDESIPPFLRRSAK